MTRTIQLHIDRKDIESIFLPEHQNNIFKGESVRDRFQASLFFTFLLVVIIYIDIKHSVFYLIYLMVIPIWIYTTVSYFIRLNKILVYRKSIKSWINSFEHARCSLDLNEDAITLNMDEAINILKWETIQYSLINEKRIVVKGEIQIFLPASSMSAEEFAFLKELIIRKVQRKYGDDENEDKLLQEQSMK